MKDDVLIKNKLHNIKDSVILKGIKYYNIPCAFDIETSSFFRWYNGEKDKCATMYIWMFGIEDLIIIGRVWDEYLLLCEWIRDILKTSDKCRLIVYVHNLGYEFQFIRKRIKWYKVFSLSKYKPVYAITNTGIEYRCSYILSGYSLAKLGDELNIFKIKKLVGNLDYSLIRHSGTPLTEKEMMYCINDVKVVLAYILETIINDGNITKIPLTKTGYVRQYCRLKCWGDRKKEPYKRLEYSQIMESLTIELDEYKQLKRAFQGGFTHCNPFYSGKIVKNVTSFDFVSSYPAVMLAEKYPMSKGKIVGIKSKDDFNEYIKYYCCIFDVEFINLQSQLFHDNYISSSRSWMLKGAIINNGRVVSAGRLCTTITEQDYLIIRKYYTWEHMKIGNFRIYKKGYLPTDFVKAIIKLYQDKTQLKGVEGKEIEYLKSKEMLNSCYGMTVTDIVRQDIVYDNDWVDFDITNCDEQQKISKYNNNRSRFLFYPWGIYVTAYARRNLFTGITELGEDYIYSDTDSVKCKNVEAHESYFRKYNELIREQLKKAMEYHGISYNEILPTTKEGKIKELGIWELDGIYSRFKTLGAKRYLVEYNDSKQINITVSGLNKKVTVPYLTKEYIDVFEAFKDGMYVPAGYTGKNTHTYINERKKGVICDYLGNVGEYDELSSVHLEAADYSLSLAREYVDYIKVISTSEFSD